MANKCMNVEIALRNVRYPWNQVILDSSQCYWKGAFFYRDSPNRIEELLRSMISALQDGDPQGLGKILAGLNGSFSFVIRTPSATVCVSDRLRSFPLFYSYDGLRCIISDDAYDLREHCAARYNEKFGSEFLATGYVTGPDTLFDGIRQVQAGEFLVAGPEDLSEHRYFEYLHGNFSVAPEDTLVRCLDEVMTGVFRRLAITTLDRGKTIVVPLSGGIDSRLIVAFLKRFALQDVICFSYGRKGSLESEISRRIARTLGFPWHFVEYTDNRWYDTYHSGEMREYERYAGNLVSLPHVQDYIAVKVLKEEGKIPENAVFVPGHTGDMISGGHLPPNFEKIAPGFDQCVELILRRHYSLRKGHNSEKDTINAFFRERARESLGLQDIRDSESMADALDYFNFKERQAKFIVNSVRTYEFFGYEWRLPLWDNELMTFFQEIPLRFRLNQDLYKKYALTTLFTGELGELAKIPCTSTAPPSREKRMKKMISRRFPLARDYIRKSDLDHKIKTEYRSHPLNWYAIMTPAEFGAWYTGHENINTYLAECYLERVIRGQRSA